MESLKSVVMVTSAQKPCGLQSLLFLYYFLYNRNSTSLKIKLTLPGKKQTKRYTQEVKTQSEGQQKHSVGITNCFPSICSVPVVELYDTVSYP